MASSSSDQQPRVELLSVCLDALECGLSMIPVGLDKKPLVPWTEYQTRLATPEEAAGWFSRHPGAQLGMVTGKLSGLMVIDFDLADPTWPPPGKELPTYAVVRTPRGGLHYYLPMVEGARNSAGAIAKGVDVRAEGGYVVFPPSRVEKGSYSFIVGEIWELTAILRQPPVLEGWILEAVLAAGTRQAAPPCPQAATDERPQEIEEGKRNDTLFRIAVRLRRCGLTQAEIETTLAKVNVERCRPPLGPKEIREILGSAARYGIAGSAGEAAARSFRRTDMGNAELIAAEFGSKMRFCHTDGQWVIWRGASWRTDYVQSVVLAANKAARLRGARGENLPEGLAKKEEVAWALKCESAVKLHAALELVAGLPGIATVAEQWDSRPELLGFQGGVLNLTTMAPVPAAQEVLIRRKLGTRFDMSAKAPLWEKFLDEVFCSDASLVQFLQRLAGYTLAGKPSEQVWVAATGSGANGKSVLLSTLRRVFGEYAVTLPFSALEERNSPSIPNDLARLAGARLAVASESGERASFDAGRLKALTGGEKISARFLHREFFDFTPVCVLWMSCNKLPRVNDSSEAFWRRAILLPFPRFFAPEERDRDLTEKLCCEAAGILAWMLRGYEEYQEKGLCPPACVCRATLTYREENDPISDFLHSSCVLGEGRTTSAADLYRGYLYWARLNAVPERETISRKTFGTLLKMRCRAFRDGDGNRAYQGIFLTGPAATAGLFPPGGPGQ